MSRRRWWELWPDQEPEGAEPARPEPEQPERAQWEAEEGTGESPKDGGGPNLARGDEAYTSSREHLADELAWVDCFVRAHAYLWDGRLEGARPEAEWGTPRLSHVEVLRYLAAGVTLPLLGEEEAADGVHSYFLELAERWRSHINGRLVRTEERGMLRLERLAWWCGLDLFAQAVLLLCLLGEVDLRYGTLFAWMQDEAERTQPSPALAVELIRVGEAAARPAAFLPQSALLRHHLVTLGGDSRSPQPARAGITLDRRVLDYLLGGNALDPALEGVIRRGPAGVTWDDLFLDEERVSILRAAAEEWRRNPQQGMALLFVGQPGSGRTRAAAALAREIDREMVVAEVAEALAWEGAGGLGDCVARVMREAHLQDALLLWVGTERLYEAGQEAHRALLLRAAADFGGPVVLAGSESQEAAGVLRHSRPILLHFPMPSLAMREQMWRRFLPREVALEPGMDEVRLAHELARTFRLNEVQVVDAVTAALSLARSSNPGAPLVGRAHLEAGARQQAARRLTGLARAVEPVAERGFDDLVLPPAVMRQIEELRVWIKERREMLDALGFERRLPLGKGLIVLFTGASGTGKTMTASLLAQDQGVSLFKVDMAALVSKWVGETEKNLARLFDQAEYTDAILFFDEADAIFGKRGEVKQAQDRWANMEVNYLLQRIEEFSGVVILTTNLRQNIDDAFLRRIQVIVDYPFPDAQEREQIWHRSLPEAPVEPDKPQGPEEPDEPTAQAVPDVTEAKVVLEVVDRERSLRALARTFRISGGSIKNIVVDAAFRAWRVRESDTLVRVSLRHLVAATAREYQKLGKPITLAEFGAEYMAWVRKDILEGEGPHGQAEADARADGVAA